MSPIANMLVQLKNAQQAGREDVVVPFSKMKLEIAKVLKDKGFVAEVEKKTQKGKKVEHNILSIKLNGGIGGINLVSKPSRKMYAGKSDLKLVRSGFGIAVVSTSKGIMAGEDAKKAGIGGEVLFEIWQ